MIWVMLGCFAVAVTVAYAVTWVNSRVYRARSRRFFEGGG